MLISGNRFIAIVPLSIARSPATSCAVAKIRITDASARLDLFPGNVEMPQRQVCPRAQAHQVCITGKPRRVPVRRSWAHALASPPRKCECASVNNRRCFLQCGNRSSPAGRSCGAIGSIISANVDCNSNPGYRREPRLEIPGCGKRMKTFKEAVLSQGLCDQCRSVPQPGERCGNNRAANRTSCVPYVDGILLTDNQDGKLHLSPLAAASLVMANGVDPIVQLTCRNRNRIALYSAELLGAAAIGVTSLVLIRGNRVPEGFQPAAEGRL